MTRIRCFIAPIALALGSLGCTNIISPEAGFESPVNPGTVLVRVTDEAGRAIVNVKVTVHMTTSSGTAYARSGHTGLGGVGFSGVPAGLRRVEIELPTGFSAAIDGLFRDVVVQKDKTTTVTFVLTR